MDKICKIINSHFTWLLEVDGEKIAFDNSGSAEYFAKHYESLGYLIAFYKEDYQGNRQEITTPFELITHD